MAIFNSKLLVYQRVNDKQPASLGLIYDSLRLGYPRGERFLGISHFLEKP